MFKEVLNSVVVFDCEYVPCLTTGRRVYDLADEVPDAEVLARMYAEAGATESQPRPILKALFYQVVSIAYLARIQTSHGVRLRLVSVEAVSERELIEKFLQAVGGRKPQLVGFASGLFDLRVLFQRALVIGAQIGAFCARPNKPWEGADYFSEFGDSHVDLMNTISPKRAKPKLSEIALACGIPGKLGMDGADVADAWREGREQEVRDYNQCDVLTTYLLWLRLAHISGHVSTPAYNAELAVFRQLLEDHVASGATHIAAWRAAWERLSPPLALASTEDVHVEQRRAA